MKFDDLLAQYLYEHKTLQLQGIGTFHLEGNVNPPSPQDKEVYYPIEGLQFKYGPKEQTDEDVIVFLVQKLGKIQPLVRSDLESYLSNIKQFLNIGKPYTIEGIGTLHKNNDGTYEFTPGNFLPVKEELSPHRETPEQQQRVKARRTDRARTVYIILTIAFVVALLAGAIWGISILMSKNRDESLVPINNDSLNTAREQDTLPVSRAPVSTVLSDTVAYNYRLVIEDIRSQDRLVNRTARLRRDGVFFKLDTIRDNSGTHYLMYVNKTMKFSDTARVKDSMRLFYARPITIERVP